MAALATRTEVKRAYDPQNMLDRNHNIQPA